MSALDPAIVEEGSFDVGAYEAELSSAPSNLAVGTKLWFENDRIRVWEVLLQPGERAPFHCHVTNYFWTVVEGSSGLQRFSDGTFVVRDYRVGETRNLDPTPETALIHDLENVGSTTLRFVTVELLD